MFMRTLVAVKIKVMRMLVEVKIMFRRTLIQWSSMTPMILQTTLVTKRL